MILAWIENERNYHSFPNTTLQRGSGAGSGDLGPVSGRNRQERGTVEARWEAGPGPGVADLLAWRGARAESVPVLRFVPV